jgi:hypothetical protein
VIEREVPGVGKLTEEEIKQISLKSLDWTVEANETPLLRISERPQVPPARMVRKPDLSESDAVVVRNGLQRR